MASSKLDIINMALGAIKAKKVTDITALNTGNDTSALNARLYYQHCKEMTIRAHKWNRTLATKELTRDSTAPLMGDWAYRYSLPNDCLRVWSLNNLVPQTDGVKYWDIEADHDRGEWLVTDETTAKIKYGYDAPEGRLDSLCVDAMVLLLASKLAQPVVGKKGLGQQLLSEWIEFTKGARSADAVESNPKPPNKRKHSKWYRARHVGNNA